MTGRYPFIEAYLDACDALEEKKNQDEAEGVSIPSEEGLEVLWNFISAAFNARAEIAECLAQTEENPTLSTDFPDTTYGKPI